MRPDHVPTMQGDANTSPGYTTRGRIFAIGHMTGLMEAARAEPRIGGGTGEITVIRLMLPDVERGDKPVRGGAQAHAAPSSRRTSAVPATSALSFSTANQRAVWLKPQSGASHSFSGRHEASRVRTRSATISGLSTERPFTSM